ncbi:MAG: hypothetical protein IJ757_07540 [Clostridiales bacterium]|nr:hypothetical protein [Clostridiales bacterium]
MKKTAKIAVSTVLVASMCIGMTGCSKAAKECKELGTEFIENAIDREVEDMADVCSDDDEALELLAPYAVENEAIDLLLERATVTAGKASVKKDGGTVVYTITLPDYEAALDEDPEDIDEFEDLLDDVSDTIDIEITLEFINKRDNWLIDNYEDFVEDFYEELYDIDFGFQSEYEGWVDHDNWWGATNNEYTGDRYYIDLDVSIVSDHYSDDMTFTWRCYKDGSLIYTSGTISDYGFLEQYCYADETSLNVEYFPAGSYTIALYDSNGVEFWSSTCTVR